MKLTYLYTYLICILFLSTSCTRLVNSQFDQYLSQKYEVPECLQNYSYASSTSLTGTALFSKRGVNLLTQIVPVSGAPSEIQLKNMSQGDPLVNNLPIRYAEVAVYNSNNAVVQCGITNNLGQIKALDGTFGLQIPAAAGTYTVRIFSRTNFNLTKSTSHFTVKQDKYTNEVYFISATAVSNGVDDTNVNLTAHARQTDSLAVEGGAFNILNSIQLAAEYIDANTAAIDTSCLNSKFDVYWKIGFNPAQYYSPDIAPENLSTITFYDPQINSLFVSGGKLGNFTFESANHFDDYVVIHEFGHHVENVCGSLLSPGGSHQVIARADPRLAWAEGWANYLAAQVMYNSIDSINPEFKNKMVAASVAPNATDAKANWTYFYASEGFSDSVQNVGSGTGFMFDLKKDGQNPDSWQMGPYIGQPFDKVNPAKYPGEGHFREGAITRGLFKLSNNCGGSCITTTPISFFEIWMAMNKLTGIGQPQYTFKSSNELLEIVKNIVTPALWGTYATFNQQPKSEALHLFSDAIYTTAGTPTAGTHNWVPYGTKLTTVTSSACSNTYHIQPRSDDPVLTSTNSDQRYSNHFYTIDLNTLAGLDEIRVTFSYNAGTVTEFDILLFSNNYFFNRDYYCPAYDSNNVCTTSEQASRNTNEYVLKSDRRSGAIATKVIRGLAQLSSTSKYLLNIRAYTANKSINTNTDYTYTIKNQNGDNICP